MPAKKPVWSNFTHYHARMEVDNQYCISEFTKACNKGDIEECPVGMFTCPFLGVADCEHVTENDWKQILKPDW